MFSDAAEQYRERVQPCVRFLKKMLSQLSEYRREAGYTDLRRDADFICLQESKKTGSIYLSDETKCCIASLIVVVAER